MTIGLSSPSLDTLVETRVETGKAIDFHYQPMEISEASGDKQGIVNSLGGLSNAYYSLGNHQKAIDFHAQHNELAKAIGDKQGIATSLGNLGNAYKSLGDYQKAIDFHSQCLWIMQAIGNKAGEALALFNLSNIYEQRGRLKLSMHYRHQAYRIWQDMNLPLVAAPFPAWTKSLIQSMGDTWAEQLIVSDKAIAWLMLPIGYLLFALRTLLSPLTYLQKNSRLNHCGFGFVWGLRSSF